MRLTPVKGNCPAGGGAELRGGQWWEMLTLSHGIMSSHVFVA